MAERQDARTSVVRSRISRESLNREGLALLTFPAACVWICAFEGRRLFCQECQSDFVTDFETSMGMQKHKFRKKGEKIVHNKYLVICLIILTITDCGLVIGELILDLYSVKKNLRESHERTQSFVREIQNRYSHQFTMQEIDDVDAVYKKIIRSTILWGPQHQQQGEQQQKQEEEEEKEEGKERPTASTVTLAQTLFRANRTARSGSSYSDTAPHVPPPVTWCANGSTTAQGSGDHHALLTLRPGHTNTSSGTHGQAAGPSGHGQHGKHGKHLATREEEIAHYLHYASLAVVALLLVEVIFKILCSGSHFFRRRIEVFDAIVILISFIVDLVFLKGLSNFAIDDSIFILAFLLPWRVIRVVNSLLVAVIDHEHVKLRLMYSRKKKLDKTVENQRNELDELKGLLQDVRSLAVKEGVDAAKIDSMLGKFAPRRRKDSKFYSLVKLVMSTANVETDKESVSSASIEMDLNQFIKRDVILNEATSDGGTSIENTVTSTNFLTVPRLQEDGVSLSDSEIDSISRCPTPSPLPSRCPSPSILKDDADGRRSRSKKSPHRVNFVIS